LMRRGGACAAAGERKWIMKLNFDFSLRARFAMIQLVFSRPMWGASAVALIHYPRRVWKWRGWLDRRRGRYGFLRIGWLQLTRWRG